MKKKVILALIMVVVLSGLFVGVRYLMQTNKYKEVVSNIVLSDIDLSKVADGNYRGSFDAILVAAEVDVRVENNEIKEIKLVSHKNDRGESAEEIIDRVVSEQSVEIDAISGATNSSKVILKAIVNALQTADK